MDHTRLEMIDSPRVRRVLAVADWSVDPAVVARALAEHDRREAVVYGVLVPARLPGLDWVGDPNAARPCARAQLGEIERLAREGGALVAEARVGDPELAPAVDDTLAGWDADEILVFEPPHRVALGRFDATRRLGRRTGLPVARFELPRRRRHCSET